MHNIRALKLRRISFPLLSEWAESTPPFPHNQILELYKKMNFCAEF